MSNLDKRRTPVTRDATDHGNHRELVQRTAAQRQRDYRLRRQRAVTEAIGAETSASRVALLALLAKDLAALETHSAPPELVGSRRRSVVRIINAIVTRYAIELNN